MDGTDRPRGSLGQELLEESGVRIDRERLRAILHDHVVVPRYDQSLRALLLLTGGAAELRQEAHRTAVLRWLRVGMPPSTMYR